MGFTRRALNKFSELYMNEFGEKLSEEETLRKAEYVMEVFRVVYGLPGIEHIDNEKEESEA